MRKTVFAICAVALSFAFSLTASAQTYEMQLNAVSPGTAPGGATVRLTGHNFGAAQAGHRVVIVHESHVMRLMRVSSWSNTQIVAVVPRDAMAGRSTIAILNPTGQAGVVNASRHVPFNVMATLKPGTAAAIKPGLGKLPGGAVTPKAPIQRIGCAVDPAVEPLRVLHPRKQPDGTYVFWLQASLKNLGTSAFSAAAGQAQYTLRMGNRVLHTRNLTNLAAGARVDAGKTIGGWRLSDEFPPDFSLEIVYGPDIRLDNNPQNDDCRMNNNKKTLSGAEVLRVLGTVR